MLNPNTQYAFIAGEVSPSFFGRTDLTKYALGAKTVQNYFVAYRGGLVSRPGSAFINELPYYDTQAKILRFAATGNDYLLVLGDKSMRFVRAGGYLLETAKPVTSISTTLEITAHGWATNDMIFLQGDLVDVKLANRYFLVGVVTTNTIELLNPDGTSATIQTTGGLGGTASRVVTIPTPYETDQLNNLQYERRFHDGEHIVIFTTLDHPRYILKYFSDTNWTFEELVTTSAIAKPTNISLTASSTATAGVAFAVTAVVNGREGAMSEYTLIENTVDYSATTGHILVEWDAVVDAESYRIYRSLILPVGTEITKGQELGYLGQSFGTQFTDRNITPDFTKSPPLFIDPFADSQINFITITASGSSYPKNTTVSLTDATGSGFDGYPIINSSGEIQAVVIVNPGRNYTSPTVVFTGSGGSGATATASLGSSSGNNPRTFRTFQQRGVYGGTLNLPMVLEGGKPGELHNFDKSPILNAGDAYTFELDSPDVEPIKHLLALKSGLLAFTSVGINLLRAEEGQAVSPLNALAEPQAYKGVSDAWPIAIDLDVLFAQEQGSSVIAMQYTDYSSTFQMQDVSVLSNHLLGRGKEITRFEWAAEPDKLLHCLREDGRLLILTYERAQEVAGWAKYETKGLYKDICNIREDRQDTIYQIVERYVNGAWRKFLEVVKSRDHNLVEDFWCVDAGLEYPLTYPDSVLTVSSISGDAVSFTTSSAVFTNDSVGDVIYFGDGKAEIISYVSTREIIAAIRRESTYLTPQTTDLLLPFFNGNWSIATPTSVVTGLNHLEGEIVSVLADGNVYLDLIVTNGEITLPHSATKIKIGLPYVCDMETLPVIFAQAETEAHRKDLLAGVIRLEKTLGIAVGGSFDKLLEVKKTTIPDWGVTLPLQTALTHTFVAGDWRRDVSFCARQRYPLPATILSLVLDTDVGDERSSTRRGG